MATKKIMVVPCIVNIRLKTCGETKLLCGYINWMRMMSGFDSGDDEKEQGINDVENTEPLVIDRGHPLVERLDPWLALQSWTF